MRRDFRPDVTLLERRSLLTAGLRGTFKGNMADNFTLTPSSQATVFGFSGKLSGVAVYGAGVVIAASPSSKFYPDTLNVYNPSGTSEVATRILSEPVSSGPRGPLTLDIQIIRATGKFRADLNTFATVTIVKKATKTGNLTVTFKPG
jgi:hypothetical protein